MEQLKKYKTGVNLGKILIDDMIKSGYWYKCSTISYQLKDFRIRLKEFSCKFHKVSKLWFPYYEGIPWILCFEYINHSNEPIIITCLSDVFVLIDEEDYKFTSLWKVVHNYKSIREEYKKNLFNMTMNDFKHTIKLFPMYTSELSKSKIKSKCAIVFPLPDEENNYYLTMKNGTIEEA